jgi:hypothetical protein
MDFKDDKLFGAQFPIVTPFSYQYGGMTDILDKIIFENGCVAYLPVTEMQIGIYFDIMGCVSFSFLNCLETLVARLIELKEFSDDDIKFLKDNFFKDGKINFSDRDLVVISGTDPDKGNGGWQVFLAARNQGLVPESMEPFDLTNHDYSVDNKLAYYNYTRSKADQKIAEEFNKRFEIKAEWVAREDWVEASKRGCLQVYTKAWYQRNGKYYNPTPGSMNHAIEMADISQLRIFDSYDPFLKELERLEDFYYFALKINLTKKSMAKPTILNNSKILMVTGGGNIGFYLDGKIIVDDPAKLNDVWIARNSKNGFFFGGPVKTLTQEQWDMFEHVNLKMEKV